MSPTIHLAPETLPCIVGFGFFLLTKNARYNTKLAGAGDRAMLRAVSPLAAGTRANIIDSLTGLEFL
jgi:hypothetical protein